MHVAQVRRSVGLRLLLAIAHAATCTGIVVHARPDGVPRAAVAPPSRADSLPAANASQSATGSTADIIRDFEARIGPSPDDPYTLFLLSDLYGRRSVEQNPDGRGDGLSGRGPANTRRTVPGLES